MLNKLEIRSEVLLFTISMRGMRDSSLESSGVLLVTSHNFIRAEMRAFMLNLGTCESRFLFVRFEQSRFQSLPAVIPGGGGDV